MTTVSRPMSEGCTVLARRMQPTGVQGASAGKPADNRPAFTGLKPSTSFAGSTAATRAFKSFASDIGSPESERTTSVAPLCGNCANEM